MRLGTQAVVLSGHQMVLLIAVLLERRVNLPKRLRKKGSSKKGKLTKKAAEERFIKSEEECIKERAHKERMMHMMMLALL